MASGPVKRRTDPGRTPAATNPEEAGRRLRGTRREAAEGGLSDPIREAVLAALERRRRTRSDLETILRRKGFKAADFSPVLDRLTEVGLVDDLQYARVYLERRAASRPRGARVLRAELLAKGVPGSLADQAIAERREDHDPLEDALRALKTWLPRNRSLEPRVRRQKLWQFLARRGFSGDVIERAALEVDVGGAQGDDATDD